MPRVLITNNTLDKYAGSELVALDLAEEFVNRGYEVSVATFLIESPISSDFSDLGVSLVDLNRIDHVDFDAPFDLAWIQHFTTIDAILSNSTFSADRIVYSSMSPFEPLECPPWYADRLSLVLANSPETKEELQKYGLAKDFVDVFPNPVAEVFFEQEYLRQSVKLESLLIVSHHPPEEVLEAIALLKAVGVRVVLVGLGFDYRRVDASFLAEFDVVLTIGRTVQQSLVMGIRVFCYDRFGGPGYLTEANFRRAADYNFSGRCCGTKYSAEALFRALLDEYEIAGESLPTLKGLARKKFRLKARLSSVLDKVALRPPLGKNLEFLKLHSRRMKSYFRKLKEESFFAQLFFGGDSKGGFDENKSVRHNLELGAISEPGFTFDFCFDLRAESGAASLRFDPLNVPVVMCLKSIAVGSENFDIEFKSRVEGNYDYRVGDIFYFGHDDPQLLIYGFRSRSAAQLKVSVEYLKVGAAALKECLNFKGFPR